jgi:predicted dehydrogenase
MKYRIGIIGLGVMGKRHCEAVRNIPEVELTAVCDLVKDNVSEVEKKYNTARGYINYNNLFKKEKIDLLIVATNGPFHAEIVKYAAKQRVKKILCEKPMATSLKLANEMINICKDYNVDLAVNYHLRLLGSYIKLKQMIHDNIIGRISHISFELGGGQFASNGGHFIDLARFLTGKEIISVLGFIDKKGNDNPRGQSYSDPGALGIIFLEGNIRVHFDMFEDYGIPSLVKIVGEFGRIIVDERNNSWEISARSKQDRHLPLTRRPSLIKIPFNGEKMDIVNSTKRVIEELISESSVSCSGHDGLKTLQAIVAVYYSNMAGNRVIHLAEENPLFDHEFSFA